MSKPIILLVEDEPDSVFFFKHVAEKVGLTNPLRVAKDGRGALDYLEGAGECADRQKHPLPGLVILDLKLPRVTGFEVLEQIRQRPETRHLIVLILTSSASDADIAKAYGLGANAYLVKPLKLEDLQATVEAIKGFWITHNRPPTWNKNEDTL
jgi:CheY-like chemotaxis protein